MEGIFNFSFENVLSRLAKRLTVTWHQVSNNTKYGWWKFKSNEPKEKSWRGISGLWSQGMHDFHIHPILFSFIVSITFHSHILLYHQIVVHLKARVINFFFTHSNLVLSFVFHVFCPLECRCFILRSLRIWILLLLLLFWAVLAFYLHYQSIRAVFLHFFLFAFAVHNHFQCSGQHEEAVLCSKWRPLQVQCSYCVVNWLMFTCLSLFLDMHYFTIFQTHPP